MVALMKYSVDGDVQRFRGIGRKNYMIRPLTSKKPCQLFPGAVHRPGCLQRPAVCPSCGVAHSIHSLHHRPGHLGWLVQCGSGVVQVNHPLSPICFLLIKYSKSGRASKAAFLAVPAELFFFSIIPYKFFLISPMAPFSRRLTCAWEMPISRETSICVFPSL